MLIVISMSPKNRISLDPVRYRYQFGDGLHRIPTAEIVLYVLSEHV